MRARAWTCAARAHARARSPRRMRARTRAHIPARPRSHLAWARVQQHALAFAWAFVLSAPT
eukprot:4198185-Alexandrium_andersonii.AAC.2